MASPPKSRPTSSRPIISRATGRPVTSKFREFKATQLQNRIQAQSGSKLISANVDFGFVSGCSTNGHENAVSSVQSEDVSMLSPRNDKLDGSIARMAKSGEISLVGMGLTEVPDCVLKAELSHPKPVIDFSFSSEVKEDDKWWNHPIVSKLILASNQIKTISPDISLLENLQVLDIHDNLLNSLPCNLADCTKLERLNLSQNQLEEIPACIFRLPDLKFLKMDRNKLCAVPSGLGDLYCLLELDLSDNSISHLPSSLNGLHVHTLLLARNKLTSVPCELGWVQSIRSLDLSGNQLTEIAKEIGELRKLERLNLANNAIKRLPVLTSCDNLKELHLASNQISEIEPDFFERAPCLKILDLGKNKLKSIPETIARCVSIERLNFEQNELTSIPTELCLLSSLKVLVVSDNPIRTIRKDIISRGTVELLKYLHGKRFGEHEEPLGDEGMPDSARSLLSPRTTDMINRKCLNFSNQRATALPEDMLTRLENADISTADLSRNSFADMPHCLSRFAGTLETLNIGNNKLCSLTPLVGQFKHLLCLDLRSNSLSSLPGDLSACKQLRELIIGVNRFGSMPEVVYELANLEAFIAHDNLIDQIDAVRLQKRLGRLTTLDLRNNNLRSVPPELGLIALKSLQLEGNPFKIPRPAQLAKGTAEVLAYLRSKLANPTG